MTSLAEAAAIFSETASQVEAEAAIQTVTKQADVYLPILKGVTPVETGALRDSEIINSISGGGVSASANVGPHIIYAEFRNDGGTITVKRAKVLGTPEVGFFGKSVTQAGSHYIEKAEAAAAGECLAIAEEVMDTLVAPLNL